MDGSGLVPEDEALGEAAQLVAQGLRKPSLSPILISAMARAFDGVILTLAFWFADFSAAHTGFAVGQSTIGAVICAVIAVLFASVLMQYKLAALRQFAKSAAAVTLIGLAAGMLGALLGTWSSVTWDFFMAAVLTLSLSMLLGRWLLSALAAWTLDYGLTERRAVVVGGGENAAELIRGLAENPENDIRICAIFDDRSDDRSPSAVVGVPKIGSVRDLIKFARSAEIDMMIITLPLGAEQRIREILERVKVLPCDVRLSAYTSDFKFRRREGTSRGQTLIDLANNPMGAGQRLAKRVFDLVIGTIALILLSPVMLVVALAIRIESKGSVFFKQSRHGYNHKPVAVWKFRSMYADQCDFAAKNVVTKDDPRVTRVGRFIRKYSLDELPQLFNVIGGSLSLVGPRPHAVAALSTQQEAYEEIVTGYAARHRVPPGVTGWAQINGWRGEIDTHEKLRARVDHDLYYIENRSLWLDLYILAITPFRLLNTENAY